VSTNEVSTNGANGISVTTNDASTNDASVNAPSDGTSAVAEDSVIRSVAHPDAVAQLVRRLWALRVDEAVLVRSLVNDVWRVTAEGRRVAVKVYRAGRWTVDQVAWEQDLARHLHGAGLTDAEPVPLVDGRFTGTFAAPEGWRPVAMTAWSAAEKPRPPFDDALYAEFGALAARFHEVAGSMSSTHPARVFPLDSALAAPSARVERALLRLGRASDAALVAHGGARAYAALSGLEAAALRRGVRHGDVSLDNVLRTPAGLALHDFDLSGSGWPAADLVGALSTPHAEAFLEGYESVRPLHPAERLALPYLRAAELIRNLDFHLVDKVAIRGIESVGEGWVDSELAALRDLPW
jgi:Ser/Thr protein kinase RdoA (MazF antagonist)